MTLLRTSALNAIAVVVRVGAAIVVNKVLALFVGPAGYAAVGQFQNFVSMLTTFGSGAINTGVTKYTAELEGDPERQHALWRTATIISTVGGILVSLALVAFHLPLSRWIFKDDRFGSIFVWLGATIILFIWQSLLLAILAGQKQIGRYVVANISSSLVGLALTGLLCQQWGLYGALLSLAITPSVVFFITLSLSRPTGWLKACLASGGIDHGFLSNLGKYALMAVTSAIVIPLSQMLIRGHIAKYFGWESAGHWQAVSKVSDIYLMLVTSTLSLYYLPRLSQIKEAGALRAEILKTYKVVLPIAAAGAGLVFVLRGWITQTLFTPEFAPIQQLFHLQLIGDILKIGGWVVGYVIVGRSMTRAYIATEIIFSFLFYFLVLGLTPVFEVRGATLAYAINYGAHWICMALVVRREIRRMGYQASMT